jgi:hypothetical protein
MPCLVTPDIAILLSVYPPILRARLYACRIGALGRRRSHAMTGTKAAPAGPSQVSKPGQRTRSQAARSGSVPMRSPAIQPSDTAPAQTRMGKRLSSASTSVEPKTRSGTEKDQQFRSFGRGGNRHHIVERHHRVGHDDDTDGGPQRVGRHDLFLTLFRAGEPDPDP